MSSASIVSRFSKASPFNFVNGSGILRESCRRALLHFGCLAYKKGATLDGIECYNSPYVYIQ